MSTFVKPSEMTHSDFKNYIKAFESLFKSEIEVLENYERDGHLLSLLFCISYERLLEDRLRYARHAVNTTVPWPRRVSGL